MTATRRSAHMVPKTATTITDRLIDELLTAHADVAHRSLIALENSGLASPSTHGLRHRSIPDGELERQ
ncbi:hypothetical protein [Arthrobacter sp. H-02-3]|uniref:hypothetical protein n=1 Tax=Arthrobacter sp. H-02-3 TaxID=2703675 RepID=UPI000E323C46|nr:hypothetical protein [Arthrobacter sp. H-02-3]